MSAPMVANRDVKPQQIRVRDRVLQVCSHGECTKGAIWDFTTCWGHLTEDERSLLKGRLAAALRAGNNLSKIVLSGADLREFDFTGVNLSEAFLNNCDLRKANFTDANLKRAFLATADLRDANMVRAELNGTVFSGAALEGVHLTAYSISFGRTPINITAASFGEQGLFCRPHVCEAGPRFAAATYRSLKAHFVADGDYDSASWASFCERLMQRKMLWEQRRFAAWLASLTFGALSGYGERPLRSLLASIAVVLSFAVLYAYTRVLIVPGGVTTFADDLAFSIATFTGFSLPETTLRPQAAWRLVATAEAFTGMFLFGVFIFTLTKRYVAR